MGAMAEPGATRLTGWGITAPTVYWWTPAGEWVMTATVLKAISVTMCASWGVAQALAKMKKSARQGFMLWQPTSSYSCHK